MRNPSNPPTTPTLQRSLGLFDVTLLGVGAIIGGGVFASMGSAAVGSASRPGAGPSLMLSVLITALCCLLTALCYSELAARMATAGSAYAYTRRAFGPRLAWLVGWCLTLEYAVANVAVALSWGEHAASLWAGPAGAETAVGAGAGAARGLGALAVLGLTALLVRGQRESTRLNNLLVLFKMAVLLLFIGLGLTTLAPGQVLHNWQPFFPNGFGGTLHGAAIVFFSFIGFDSVATVAEEVEAPQRTIPRAIMASLGLCALLYVAVAAVLTGAAPGDSLAERLGQAASQPLTVAVGLLGPGVQWARPCIAIGALVAQTTALWAFQLAQARVFYAMARDGMLPAPLARLHPRHATPHVATWAAGLGVAAATLLFDLHAMLDLTDIGTLFIFAVTNACVPMLRRQDADAASTTFRVPGGAYLVPVAGTLACLGLMLYLPAAAWSALLIWLGIGIGIDRWRRPGRSA